MENYNISLVAISYVISVVGSLMALIIIRAVLQRPIDSGAGGLVGLAALCLGGVGIWSMHFIGMLAYHIHDLYMSFNWSLTMLSFLVGVVVVYIGMLMICRGETKFFKLVLAGLFVGLGVAGMHYTGMLAMQMQAEVSWDSSLIAISIAIAVVAAIVALWLAVKVTKMWQILGSALLMGLAVCGMHYTGMVAASFHYDPNLEFVKPLPTSITFFVAAIAAIDIVIVLISMVVAMLEANKRDFTSFEQV